MTDPNSQSLLFGVGFDIRVDSNCLDSSFVRSDGTYSLFVSALREMIPGGLLEIHDILDEVCVVVDVDAFVFTYIEDEVDYVFYFAVVGVGTAFACFDATADDCSSDCFVVVVGDVALRFGDSDGAIGMYDVADGEATFGSGRTIIVVMADVGVANSQNGSSSSWG